MTGSYELRSADNALIGSFASRSTALTVAHAVLSSEAAPTNILLRYLDDEDGVHREDLLILDQLDPVTDG